MFEKKNQTKENSSSPVEVAAEGGVTLRRGELQARGLDLDGGPVACVVVGVILRYSERERKKKVECLFGLVDDDSSPCFQKKKKKNELSPP